MFKIKTKNINFCNLYYYKQGSEVIENVLFFFLSYRTSKVEFKFVPDHTDVKYKTLFYSFLYISNFKNFFSYFQF